jgi:hypothetical protein
MGHICTLVTGIQSLVRFKVYVTAIIAIMLKSLKSSEL